MESVDNPVKWSRQLIFQKKKLVLREMEGLVQNPPFQCSRTWLYVIEETQFQLVEIREKIEPQLEEGTCLFSLVGDPGRHLFQHEDSSC